MNSYFIISEDGENWTPRTLVTSNSGNVHDTDLFVREDGDIDMYYSYTDPSGFVLWRRCLGKDGTLGPEEKVLGSDWGSVVKPRAHRLGDGQILLSYVDQSQGHFLYYSRLWGDAVCPE